MPALAQRFEGPTFEPTFVENITHFVEAMCHRYGVRGVEVEDVGQEALTQIVASIATFRREECDFDTWARGVALNVIRRHLRCAKRHGVRFSKNQTNVDDHATPEPSPEQCVQRKQAWCRLSNALENLTTRQVNVLVSFDVHDMSHKEIGTKLNIRENASHKCHKRARKTLAKCLDRELLSVMPPFLTSCNEPSSGKDFVSSDEISSRWTDRSHYASQILGSIVALLLLVPACFEPQSRAILTEDARVLGVVQNAVMYSSDELSKVQDEPAVLQDAPTVKPEPASLTSVRNVPTPTKSRDKQTYVQDLAPLPPYKHTPEGLDNRLPGR